MGIIKESRFKSRFKKIEFSNPKQKGGASGRSKGWIELNKERHSHKSVRTKKEKKTIKGAIGKELGEIGNWVCILLFRFLGIFEPSVAVFPGAIASSGVEAWHFGAIVTIATPMVWVSESTI